MKTSLGRWDALVEALQDLWPNLNADELISTRGEVDRITKLIIQKYHEQPEHAHEIVAEIVQRTMLGNPHSLDENVGTKIFQESPSKPNVSEWEARESEGPTP
ncbi:MAG: hypothetical protein AB7I27_01650 [Bacteriovoracaceae bacterium]